MAHLREILTEGHPTLRKVAKKVRPEEFEDPLFHQLIDDMFTTMYHAQGIGLAAPQINLGKRIFVVDLQDEEGEFGPLVFVNPKLTVMEGKITSLEGCLSVPGMIGDVERHERVVCTAFDRKGRKFSLEANELFGRCIQHELDHLDGILYIDKAQNIRPAVTDEEKRALEEREAVAS